MSLRAELMRLALRKFVKGGAKPASTIEELRRGYEAIKRLIPNPPPGTVATRVDAGGVSAVRVATAESRDDRHILYLHGGAYINGSPSHYRDFIWRLANATKATVLCIDYRLAPEHPFPAAVEDAVAAYSWLGHNGADPRRTAIIGDSAGGGLTFATLLKLRDLKLALPSAAVTMSPWTDLTLTSLSFRNNAKADPMLNAAHAPQYVDWYLGGADPRDPYASPIHGDAAGLPPSLILVGSDEILLDDAVRMAERLRAAGSRAELEIWPRMPHVWPLMARVVPEGRRAIARIGAFVQREMAAG